MVRQCGATDSNLFSSIQTVYRGATKVLETCHVRPCGAERSLAISQALAGAIHNVSWCGNFASLPPVLPSSLRGHPGISVCF